MMLYSVPMMCVGGCFRKCYTIVECYHMVVRWLLLMFVVWPMLLYDSPLNLYSCRMFAAQCVEQKAAYGCPNRFVLKELPK